MQFQPSKRKDVFRYKTEANIDASEETFELQTKAALRYEDYQ